MKLKLDENLGRSVAELFRQAGHDTTTVPSEGLCSGLTVLWRRHAGRTHAHW